MISLHIITLHILASVFSVDYALERAGMDCSYVPSCTGSAQPTALALHRGITGIGVDFFTAYFPVS